MSENLTKDEAMSEQGMIFADLLDELQMRFHAMPAPETNALQWGHVESAKKINADLKELIAFLSK